MEHYYYSTLQMKQLAAAVVLVVILFAAAVEEANGQSICNVPREGLEACRPSVTPPNPAAPSGECCGYLAGADWACFCSYRNSVLLQYLGVDPNLAMQLPAKCNLNAPPGC